MFLSLRNSAILCAFCGLKKLTLRTQSVRKSFAKDVMHVVETNPLLPQTIEFVATLPDLYVVYKSSFSKTLESIAQLTYAPGFSVAMDPNE